MGICDGRVVIITGAGRGLGRSYALAFAAEGAKVVVNDLGASLAGMGRDLSTAQAVVDEIRAAGGEAVANGDDVADWDGAANIIRTAVDTFGTLDVIVNNAGMVIEGMDEDFTDFAHMSEKDWDFGIAINLKSQRHQAIWEEFLTINIVVARMRARRN